jgi:hypothetical protein
MPDADFVLLLNQIKALETLVSGASGGGSTAPITPPGAMMQIGSGMVPPDGWIYADGTWVYRDEFPTLDIVDPLTASLVAVENGVLSGDTPGADLYTFNGSIVDTNGGVFIPSNPTGNDILWTRQQVAAANQLVLAYTGTDAISIGAYTGQVHFWNKDNEGNWIEYMSAYSWSIGDIWGLTSTNDRYPLRVTLAGGAFYIANTDGSGLWRWNGGALDPTDMFAPAWFLANSCGFADSSYTNKNNFLLIVGWGGQGTTSPGYCLTNAGNITTATWTYLDSFTTSDGVTIASSDTWIQRLQVPDMLFNVGNKGVTAARVFLGYNGNSPRLTGPASTAGAPPLVWSTVMGHEAWKDLDVYGSVYNAGYGDEFQQLSAMIFQDPVDYSARLIVSMFGVNWSEMPLTSLNPLPTDQPTGIMMADAPSTDGNHHLWITYTGGKLLRVILCNNEVPTGDKVGQPSVLQVRLPDSGGKAAPGSLSMVLYAGTPTKFPFTFTAAPPA